MPEWLAWAGTSLRGVSPLDALRAVLAAFVFGQVLAIAYERTFHGVSYARGFTHTLVLASIAAATFVMAIGRSLYAGLGLLGVLSMIRFRANLKAPRDLVFLLGATTAGVASGVDALAVAAIGTGAFVLAALYLHHAEFGSRREFDGVVRFTLPATAIDPGVVSRVLAQHCAKVVPLSVADLHQGGAVEHTYQVRLRGEGGEALVTTLREELGAEDARVLVQDATLEY